LHIMGEAFSVGLDRGDEQSRPVPSNADHSDLQATLS
jgi:hypothetical protein